MATRKLQVEIVGDASSLQRAFGKANQGSSRLGSSLKTLGKVAAVGVGAAFAGLAATIKVGFDEIAESQKVLAQTGAVLKSTGGAANVTAKQVEGLAGSLSKMSGVDDEAIQSGENMLLTFTRIRNEVGKGNDIFDQATKATLNLSVAMGKDMQSSAILVGKALNDPIKGMSALSKAGIQFTEEQKKTIKGFVDTGQAIKAQKIILGELETQFGGSAKAFGETMPGQLAKLRNAFDELAAKIAGALLPHLQSLVTWINEHMPQIEAAVSTAIEGAGSVITALAPAFESVKRAALSFLQTAREIAPTLQAIGGVALSIGLSNLGQSAGGAAVAMVAFHVVLDETIERLVAMRKAGAGLTLSTLVGPVGIATVAVGAIAFAFLQGRRTSDEMGDSINRLRSALQGLKSAADESNRAQQDLRDTKIGLKQATLDVSTAIARRNQLDKDGKKGTDEYKQAQLDVQRQYSNRIRLEQQLKSSQDGVTAGMSRGNKELKNLVSSTRDVQAGFQKASVYAGLFGEKARSQNVAKYAAELNQAAKKADAIAAAAQNVNPRIAEAAKNFAANAREAANLAKRTGEIPQAFDKVVGPAGSAGQRIGSALGLGIKAGIGSQIGAISAAAAQAVRAAESAARAEAKAKSPSELFAALGRDIGEGMRKGLVEQYGRLGEAAKTAADTMISAGVAAISARRGEFSSAFSELTSAATAAFDRLASGVKTKSEKLLEAFDLRQAVKAAKEQIQELQKAVADAREAQGKVVREDVVRTEGESDEAFAARQKSAEDKFNEERIAAQERVNEALVRLADERETQRLAKQRAGLEKAAGEERTKLEDQQALNRRHLEERLKAAGIAFETGRISFRQYNERIEKIMKDFHIPFKKGAGKLGGALAEGLTDALAEAGKAAKDLLDEIVKQLKKFKIVIKVDVVAANQGNDGPPGMASGGRVRRGRPYVVGERRAELFVPDQSGRILSSVPGAGGGTIENHTHVYLDSREIFTEIQRKAIRFQNSNATPAFQTPS